MRSLSKAMCLVTLCLAVASCNIGCSSISTATGFGNTPTLTPEQKTVKQQNSIKLGAALATKGALIGLDPAEAKNVATIANTVANDIIIATNNGTIDLTTIRQLALDKINSGSGSAKQKMIVGQVVDALALLVQDYIDNNFATAPDTDKRTATINAIRAAAAGVNSGTVLFLN